MCIAIGQPADTKTLTIEALEEGWKTNPDGGGYAFINNQDKLVMVHSMDKDEFILRYLEDHAEYGTNSPFMLHMRIATHGGVNIQNCHPFKVDLQGDSQMAMMHNGIISKMEPYIKGTDLTDTQGLIENVLSSMSDEWLDNDILFEMIEEYIDWSKLVFLTNNPELSKELYILNEDMGVWKDDVWYSNYSCFLYPRSKYNYKKKNEQNDYEWVKDDATAFGWYNNNGQYIEGTGQAYADACADGLDKQEDEEKLGFEAWLLDDDNRRATAKELATATHEQHVEYFNESMILGDACSVCCGIRECICDEICVDCYEGYHECACYGHWCSLANSFDDKWGDRVIALVDSQLTSAKNDSQLKLTDGCE